MCTNSDVITFSQDRKNAPSRKFGGAFGFDWSIVLPLSPKAFTPKCETGVESQEHEDYDRVMLFMCRLIFH